jgi:hypothetical protein
VLLELLELELKLVEHELLELELKLVLLELLVLLDDGLPLLDMTSGIS